SCKTKGVEGICFIQVQQRPSIGNDKSHLPELFCCKAQLISSSWKRSASANEWRRTNSIKARRTISSSLRNQPACINASSSLATSSGNSTCISFMVTYSSTDLSVAYRHYCVNS